MARPDMTKRIIAALALLAVVAAVCVSLGNWQLDRAAEREAIAQSIERGRQSAPLPLRADTPPQEFQEWRRAQATGTWLPHYTVLLDNRNREGRPGLWVATPLLIGGEAGNSGTALLVLRGWVPRPVGAGERIPDLTPPAGMQTITGQMVQRVPRLFELWSFGGPGPSALPQAFPAPDGNLPRVQNLPLADYAVATGLKLLPVVLEQTSSDAAGPDAIVSRDWPLPSIDSDTNRGYALQWFSFAAIAAIAWVAIAWRTLRKRARRPDSHS